MLYLFWAAPSHTIHLQKFTRQFFPANPFLAVLHTMSTAVEVLTNSGAGYVVDFASKEECEEKMQYFEKEYMQFLEFYQQYNPANINMLAFEKYSAYNITETLVQALNKITGS